MTWLQCIRCGYKIFRKWKKNRVELPLCKNCKGEQDSIRIDGFPLSELGCWPQIQSEEDIWRFMREDVALPKIGESLESSRYLPLILQENMEERNYQKRKLVENACLPILLPLKLGLAYSQQFFNALESYDDWCNIICSELQDYEQLQNASIPEMLRTLIETPKNQSANQNMENLFRPADRTKFFDIEITNSSSDTSPLFPDCMECDFCSHNNLFDVNTHDSSKKNNTNVLSPQTLNTEVILTEAIQNMEKMFRQADTEEQLTISNLITSLLPDTVVSAFSPEIRDRCTFNKTLLGEVPSSSKNDILNVKTVDIEEISTNALSPQTLNTEVILTEAIQNMEKMFRPADTEEQFDIPSTISNLVTSSLPDAVVSPLSPEIRNRSTFNKTLLVDVPSSSKNDILDVKTVDSEEISTNALPPQTSKRQVSSLAIPNKENMVGSADRKERFDIPSTRSYLGSLFPLPVDMAAALPLPISDSSTFNKTLLFDVPSSSKNDILDVKTVDPEEISTNALSPQTSKRQVSLTLAIPNMENMVGPADRKERFDISSSNSYLGSLFPLPVDMAAAFPLPISESCTFNETPIVELTSSNKNDIGDVKTVDPEEPSTIDVLSPPTSKTQDGLIPASSISHLWTDCNPISSTSSSTAAIWLCQNSENIGSVSEIKSISYDDIPEDFIAGWTFFIP